MTSAPSEKQTMKASKPAMEKRRRARINESLQQLKSLVLDGLNKNNPRHSKLEKADILEMTVRYLRNVQRQQVKTSVDVDPAVLTKYRTGFAECMGEVSRYLGGAMDENPEVRARLLGHLAGLCTSHQQHRGQQPINSGGPHSQTQGTNHMQPSPKPAAASQGLDAMARPSPSIQVNSAQLPYANFPTPPPSRAHKVAGGRQPVATFLTSPKVEGARTGLPRQAPIVQDQQLPLTTSSQSDTPVAKGASTQSVIVSQSLPARASPHPRHFNDMITLVLPSQSLPGGQVPTHLIPVYAPQANAITSLPEVVAFQKPSPVATVSAERSGNISPAVSPASTASPRMTSTAPATITNGQQAAWTAIPISTAQLISPRPGAVAPSIIAPPLAISFPFNAEISPPRLASHEKPREQMRHPIRLSGVYPNYEVSGDDDPMWRPW